MKDNIINIFKKESKKLEILGEPCFAICTECHSENSWNLWCISGKIHKVICGNCESEIDVSNGKLSI